jgi:hypothetical protein
MSMIKSMDSRSIKQEVTKSETLSKKGCVGLWFNSFKFCTFHSEATHHTF